MTLRCGLDWRTDFAAGDRRARLWLMGALWLCVAALLWLAPAARADGTWSPQASGTTNHLRGVSFPDATHGWAVGDNGTIVATSDGGATWIPQASGTTSNLRAVSFPDATHGWAVGVGDTIVATSDGGATWTPQAAPAVVDALSGVSFADATHGWVTGFVGGGEILATSDGGATWTSQATGGSGLFGVSFADATHGWAVGVGDDSNFGEILATSDGGANWSPQLGGTPQLFGVSFPDATHGWAVGDVGAIVATIDGGASWSPQVIPAGYEGTTQTGVSFPDSAHGWSVGSAGVIVATSDGGATWTPQASGTTTTLLGVSSPDPSHGWAVGDGGTILAFTETPRFDFAGFFSPVDNLPTRNSVKAGAAVPVKFSLAGDQGLHIFAEASPKSEKIACDSSALVDGIEETVNAGGSSLQYNPVTDQYTYVWKTDKTWAKSCRQLVVKLSDGTVHRANFELR
jgi:photosystem II stability/assembly factor-like uncharacterized protein